MITIYPSYTASEGGEANTSFFSDCSDLLGARVHPFSSARASTVFALRALGFTRMDEVLIPPYMSDCVVSAISKTAFASMTRSKRTRAVYVFHQFGYPQRIDQIEKIARENDWYIINCCVHATFSYHSDIRLPDWGDFTVLSLPKYYPCNLGGGLVSGNETIQRYLDSEYEELYARHEKHADKAFDSLVWARKNLQGTDEQFEINSVYGYLPGVVTFPSGAYTALPSDIDSIRQDIGRRKKLLRLIHGRFPDLVPETNDCDVVPSAVPIQLPLDLSQRISSVISDSLEVEVPVMHFDFNLNMLDPDYRTSLIIGCHQDWHEDLVGAICDLIEKYVE